MNDERNFLEKKLIEFKEMVSCDDFFPINRLLTIASKIKISFDSGCKLVFIGNGGSAAEATHLAAEFIGKCVVDHRPLPAMSLADSQSILTAVPNDYGIEFLFSRQIEALVREGDVAIVLSTSGKSANILKSIETLESMKVDWYLWTGSSTQLGFKERVLNVPSTVTPRIQEAHLFWGHVLAELIEKAYT